MFLNLIKGLEKNEDKENIININIQRLLGDKTYEKRKKGAQELAELIKILLINEENDEQEYVDNLLQHPNNEDGALHESKNFSEKDINIISKINSKHDVDIKNEYYFQNYNENFKGRDTISVNSEVGKNDGAEEEEEGKGLQGNNKTNRKSPQEEGTAAGATTGVSVRQGRDNDITQKNDMIVYEKSEQLNVSDESDEDNKKKITEIENVIARKEMNEENHIILGSELIKKLLLDKCKENCDIDAEFTKASDSKYVRRIPNVDIINEKKKSLSLSGSNSSGINNIGIKDMGSNVIGNNGELNNNSSNEEHNNQGSYGVRRKTLNNILHENAIHTDIFNKKYQNKKIIEIINFLDEKFIKSVSTSERCGGLISLAFISISLNDKIKYYFSEILKIIISCINDQDSKVRYYVCESLYNLCKISKGVIFYNIEDIFDCLYRIFSDSCPNVKNGGAFLDNLLKDMTCSYNNIFNIYKIIYILKDKICIENANVRQLIISWLFFLQNIPTINIFEYFHFFVKDLFLMLSDENKDIQKQANQCLDLYIDKIVTLNYEQCRLFFRHIAHIFLDFSGHKNAIIKHKCLLCVYHFINILNIHFYNIFKSTRKNNYFITELLKKIISCTSDVSFDIHYTARKCNELLINYLKFAILDAIPLITVLVCNIIDTKIEKQELVLNTSQKKLASHSGIKISGNKKSGSYNSGNYNSGNYNSGNYNLCSQNSGNYNNSSNDINGSYNKGNSNTHRGRRKKNNSYSQKNNLKKILNENWELNKSNLMQNNGIHNIGRHEKQKNITKESVCSQHRSDEKYMKNHVKGKSTLHATSDDEDPVENCIAESLANYGKGKKIFVDGKHSANGGNGENGENGGNDQDDVNGKKKFRNKSNRMEHDRNAHTNSCNEKWNSGSTKNKHINVTGIEHTNNMAGSSYTCGDEKIEVGKNNEVVEKDDQKNEQFYHINNVVKDMERVNKKKEKHNKKEEHSNHEKHNNKDNSSESLSYESYNIFDERSSIARNGVKNEVVSEASGVAEPAVELSVAGGAYDKEREKHNSRFMYNYEKLMNELKEKKISLNDNRKCEAYYINKLIKREDQDRIGDGGAEYDDDDYGNDDHNDDDYDHGHDDDNMFSDSLERRNIYPIIMCLQWLIEILIYKSEEIKIYYNEIIICVFKCLKNDDNQVVLLTLTVLSAMCSTVDNKFNFYENISANLILLFKNDEHLLVHKGKIIVQHISRCLNNQKFYAYLSYLLINENNFLFVNKFIQVLNWVLLTSNETKYLRNTLFLKKYYTLFSIILIAWFNNPLSAISFLLWLQKYELAYFLCSYLTLLDLDADFFHQLDNFIFLFESPVFSKQRLHLIYPKNYPFLIKSLMILSLMLPLNTSNNILQKRLQISQLSILTSNQAVSNFFDLHNHIGLYQMEDLEIVHAETVEAKAQVDVHSGSKRKDETNNAFYKNAKTDEMTELFRMGTEEQTKEYAINEKTNAEKLNEEEKWNSRYNCLLKNIRKKFYKEGTINSKLISDTNDECNDFVNIFKIILKGNRIIKYYA
ncbi:conserved Plasmodium protein, unknown function [Plasmodium malariae]|uniref:Vacuolar protein 14 C-terminal Fig4-binding domain-containing protein n=1 Tax=Plasmodium malariae TaxID=5858 RepID=A0A1D3TF30_PLAMA|nr:conserved Plasmodium protein, unknown function [Plasmodium malariae]SCP03540.1 conserved Plasmodium protein, unknown function [Plasmodium malariae]